MIKLEDRELISYFEGLKEGEILSKNDVIKHLNMFSIDFNGVATEGDLETFKVSKSGSLMNKKGIMGDPIQLKPVFEKKMKGTDRDQAHWSFMESFEKQTLNRMKNVIGLQAMISDVYQNNETVRMIDGPLYDNMESRDLRWSDSDQFKPYQQNSQTKLTAEPWERAFVVPTVDGGKLRSTIPELTVEQAKGTKMFNELMQETLLGTTSKLTYNKDTRRHTLKNRIHENDDTADKPVARSDYKRIESPIEEPKGITFSEKMTRSQSLTMHIEDPDVEELLREMDWDDLSKIEHMSPQDVTREFEKVKKVLSDNISLTQSDELAIDAEVDKVLGVDASDEDKKRYRDMLYKKEIDSRLLEEVEAFQRNAQMHRIENRDYISPDQRGATREEMENDIYKEEQSRKKLQKDNDDYLKRLRESTHTQDEDGTWVKNAELPGKQTDKLSQAIAIDANPLDSDSSVASNILQTIERGRQNYNEALANIEPERQKLKSLTDEYNTYFKRVKTPTVTSTEQEAAMQDVVGRFLSGDASLTPTQTALASEYINVSQDIEDHLVLAETSHGIRPQMMEKVRELEGQQLYLMHGITREDYKESERRLTELGEQIREQTKEVNRVDKLIINKGYDSSFDRTVVNPETNTVQRVAVSKEMYDRHFDNPSLSTELLNAEAEQKILYQKRQSARNITSWHNAQEKGDIVKGSYSDNMGYVITHINEDNMVYMQRPTIKTTDLNYSLNISNADLLTHLGDAEEDFLKLFNPTSDDSVIDKNLMFANLEDVENGHVTLHAQLPRIELKETEMSKEEITRANNDIYKAISGDKNQRYTSLPSWALDRVEMTTLELHKERRVVGDALAAEKERIKKMTEAIAKGEIDEYGSRQNALAILEEMKESIKGTQARFTNLKNIEASVYDSVSQSILSDLQKEKFTKGSLANDRIQKELKEFHIEEVDGVKRIALSREGFTKILLGTDTNTTQFYKKMIGSHFGHLENDKGNGSSSVGDAVMNIIDEHIVLGSEFNLSDDALIRRYMNGINPDALNKEDFSIEQQKKITTYAESLKDKGIYDRVRDRLFQDIVKKGMETAHDMDDGMSNIVRAIYTNQSMTMPEADITGQSMYAYIHNKENAVNARLKNTYQREVLSLSVDQLDNILSRFKDVGNSVPLSLDKEYQEGGAVYNPSTVDSYDIETIEYDPESKKMVTTKKQSGDFLAANLEIYGKELDVRDFDRITLDGAWPELIEEAPHMKNVQDAIKRAGLRYRRTKSHDDSLEMARLNLYSLGVLNHREKEFEKILTLKDLATIKPDENLVQRALSNTSAMNERQVATLMTLAEQAGTRVDATAPVAEGIRGRGYLKFNEKNEIEFFSPEANQSYIVNDAGKSTTTTIRAEDTGAYKTNNRLSSAESYSKQQPIIKTSVANEAQLKRTGDYTVLSNIDGSFGEMVDFAQQGHVGISYDIETTMTGPRYLQDVVQPIEIFGQQLQFDTSTGKLLRDVDGNFGVRAEAFEEIEGEDGTINKKKVEIVKPKEFHAIVALDNPAKDLITKIADGPDYFNVSTRSRGRIHLVDYMDALEKRPSTQSSIDFLKEQFNIKKIKSGEANRLVNEMSQKAEEFKFLNNVAKYAFGSEKDQAAVDAFGRYSNFNSVDTSNEYAGVLKQTDREKYNSFFDESGAVKSDMILAFEQDAYAHQTQQTAKLISDAQQAAINLEDRTFNYGEGTVRLSTAEALNDFTRYIEDSDAKVIFGQNVEKADNKTLVQAAQNLEKQLEIKKEISGDADVAPERSLISEQLTKIKERRQSIFDEAIGEYTDAYKGKFIINPMAAPKATEELESIIAEGRDPAGYLNSRKKIPVANLSEALAFIPEMNRSGANYSFKSDVIQTKDAEINVLTSMFEKFKFSGGQLTEDEMVLAKEMQLFDGNEFAIQNNATKVDGLSKKITTMFERVGVVDQQTIARIAYPELRSQSNASLMKYFNSDSTLAHDGKVDTLFVSENIERFAGQINNYYNGEITPDNEALAKIISSIDLNPTGEGSMMERNSYKGGEFVSFIKAPEDGIQKGVYQLQEISEDGKVASFNRMILGENGLIADTSVPTYEMSGLTNAELAHRFAENVQFLEPEMAESTLLAYNDDISRRHFEKVLNNNFSYESHMNQIRELEIQAGIGNEIFQNNPLFSVEAQSVGTNLLDADMEGMIDASDGKGVVQLETNPLERARRLYNESLNEDGNVLSDIERSLLLNKTLINDNRKEKFYNKDLSKEQLLALQELNDFNHTELGIHLGDMMDDISALESQDLINPAEKANLLKQWNEELKARAEKGGHTYNVRDAASIPDFTLQIQNKATGTIRNVDYLNTTIQTASPVEVSNSLTGIANKILSEKGYTPAPDTPGLRADFALNDVLLPHFRDMGLVKETDFMNNEGKPRFVGVGELSHTIFNNLRENPTLLNNPVAIDYLGMSLNISKRDMKGLQKTTDTLLAPFFERQTEVQAMQFDNLLEDKRMLRDAGVYIPGMKLIPHDFDIETIDTLSRFSNQSNLSNMYTSDLVTMADGMAGLGDDSSLAKTKMIYNEIGRRAATASDGTISIDPNEIVKDYGNTNRMDAAVAMNWIAPAKTQGLYRAVDDITERRMVGTKFAGAKLGDVPEALLDTISNYGMRDSQKFDYEGRKNYSPYMQQQEEIINWRDTGYEGHDHSVDNKYYTARGEEPDYAAMNEAIKAEDEARGGARRNPTQFNEQEVEQGMSRDNYVNELAEKSREASFPNNTSVSGEPLMNVQSPVDPEQLRVKEKPKPEMFDPTPEREGSGFERYIERTKAEVSDNIKNFLSGESGGKWVAGLGVAAAALFTVNAMNSPLKLENRPDGHGVKGVTGTPEDDKERQPIKSPEVQVGGTSYVTSGEKGYTIKASGRTPSNIDSSQLQSTINNSMGDASSVNINLRDDRTTLDNSWLERQFSNFIERGHVGGD